MQKLMLWSQSNPIPVLIGLVLVCALAGTQVSGLRIDTSIEGMMVQGGPDIAHYEDSMQKFGSDQMALVFVKDAALFTPEKLTALEAMVTALEKVDDVQEVESLFSVNNFKSVDGSLNSGPLMIAAPPPNGSI